MTPPNPPPDYFARTRDDIFALVPKSPGLRVLDVGCGEGALGRRLRDLGQRVHGVELSPAAAAVAAQVLDEVIVGDAEKVDLGFADEFFDTIVLGDVLEHFYDPWGFMTRMRRVLKPRGRIVASIPNIQYFPVVLNLLLGKFEYRRHGILDISHIRFFTAREVEKMFTGAGFQVTDTPTIYPYRHPLTRKLAAGIDRVSLGVFSRFLIGNIFVVARKAVVGKPVDK